MNYSYNLKEHGDPLEKEYADFIHAYFRTYEEVWKLYIGNKGNNTKADIPGYPNEREMKRQTFSEHTYTILQSVILLHRLISKDSFINATFITPSDRLDLQDNLLLFFTHLGRIRDNVEDASTCLLNTNTKEITVILDEFYHKRHILIHGKMIPIIFKSSGEILIPVLSKTGVDISGWNHKQHNWADISNMNTESLETTVTQLYWDLLPKLTEIFGHFKSKVEVELNDGNFNIAYDRSKVPTGLFGSSGYSGVDVYGLAHFDPYKK